MPEWEFEAGFLDRWRSRFEASAVSGFETYCTTDEAFEYLAHGVAVEAVAEHQAGLTAAECYSAVSELASALLAEEHAS
jgi:hypothetical protein